MEQRDLKLIERYIASDTCLRKLYEEHLNLERRLAEFNQKIALTPDEELQKKNLKKFKLRGRDQIENILKKYRGADKAS